MLEPTTHTTESRSSSELEAELEEKGHMLRKATEAIGHLQIQLEEERERHGASKEHAEELEGDLRAASTRLAEDSAHHSTTLAEAEALARQHDARATEALVEQAARHSAALAEAEARTQQHTSAEALAREELLSAERQLAALRAPDSGEGHVTKEMLVVLQRALANPPRLKWPMVIGLGVTWLEDGEDGPNEGSRGQ